jgi:hypothetical protein
MPLSRSPYARTLLLAAVVAAVVGGSPIATGHVSAQPVSGTYRPYTTAPVSLESSAVAVPSNGVLAYEAVVRLTKPTPYLQVRLRVRRPSGRLLYQKTFVRSDVPAGTQVFSFARSLTDLDLEPALYPVELAVDAEGPPTRSWETTDSLRVYEATAPPMPVAILVKVSAAPAIDPEGRFATDPALETRARDEVLALADAVLSKPALRISLAIAPQMLAEWRQIESGYEIAGPAGIVKVSADDPTSRSYANATAHLKAALATGRLELLDVPYADPDIAGISSVKRVADLGAHYQRGMSTYFASIEQTPSAGTFTARGCMTVSAAREAARSGIRYALVSQRFARSRNATSPPGVYSSKSVPLTVLVPDAALAGALAGGEAAAVTDALFDRAIQASEGTPTSVPVVVETGPGRTASIDALVGGLSDVLGEPWLAFRTAGEVAATASRDVVRLPERAAIGKNTPPDWWDSVAHARQQAEALAAASPADNRDADDAVVDSLIAESAYWSGPDGLWALADRARSFVAATERRADAVFSKVGLVAKDVTLSGARGSVPVSISNDSGEILSVVLLATPSGVNLVGPRARKVTLLPAENYLTIPVDLRSSVGGTLRLDVLAGTAVIASETVGVKASYLDKLAVVAGIAILLGGLLLYIRKRVRTAERSGRSG